MMSKRMKDARISLMLTMIFMVVSGLSLSLIPFINESATKDSNPMGYVIAAIFWLGCFAALLAAYITRRRLRHSREKLIAQGMLSKQRAPGAFSFSGGKRNIVIYAMIVIGLILSVTDIMFGYIPELIMFPIISVTIILFSAHCVVDGKYYKVYQQMKESMKYETKD